MLSARSRCRERRHLGSPFRELVESASMCDTCKLHGARRLQRVEKLILRLYCFAAQSQRPGSALHPLAHPYSRSIAMALTCSDICKFIAAIFLPPLGVFLEMGCHKQVCINILLTLLVWVPGVIHAFYIIIKH